MRILHIIPSLTLAGAEMLVKDMAIISKAEKNDVTILVFVDYHQDLYDKLSANKIKVICNNSKNAYSLSNIIFLWKHLRQNKYDIVHAHLTPAQLYLAIIDSMLKLKTILITTEHNTYNRRRGNKLLRYFDCFIYSRFDKVVSITQATQDALIEWVPAIRNKSIIINNGIDVNKFHVTRNWKNNNKEIIALCVARFEPQKGQDILIRALALTQDIKLLLVGDGVLKKKIEQLTKDLGITDKVKFLGIRPDIADLISMADIYVQPSHWEGFGIAALEAMAGGLAVVVSDVPGLRDVVGKAGLRFKSGQFDELAGILQNLANNKGCIRKFSELAAKRAQDFTIESSVKHYLQLYRDLLQIKSKMDVK